MLFLWASHIFTTFLKRQLLNSMKLYVKRLTFSPIFSNWVASYLYFISSVVSSQHVKHESPWTASQSQENACIALLCCSNTSLCHKLQPTYIRAWSLSVQDKTLRDAAVYKRTNSMCVVCFTLRNIVRDWFRGPWRLANSLISGHPTKILIVHASSPLTWATHKCCFSFVTVEFSADAVETEQLMRYTRSIRTWLYSCMCHNNSSHRKQLEICVLAFLITCLVG